MNELIKINAYSFFIIVLSLFLVNISIAQDSTPAQKAKKGFEVTGEFSPSGQTKNKPLRIDAGKSCIVELTEPYTISGSLSGEMEFNYRILVKGPCGSPAGTYDEEWIAYGTFNGKFNNKPASGTMTYTANVKAGGKVDGIIEFGKGLDGKLQVYGSFSDGKLSYKRVIK